MLSIEGQLILTILLLLANAFFVAAEFALIKAQSSHIDELARRGNPLANVARKIIHNLDASLAAAQLGVTFASLGLGWIGEPAVARFLRPVFITIGVESSAALHGVSFAVAFALISAAHVIIGEQLPKFLGIRKPHEVALWIATPFICFRAICYPLLTFLNACTNGLLRLFGVQDVKIRDLTRSEEELRLILSESQRQGSLSAGEVNMLENVLALAGRTVMEIMSPRPDVDCLFLNKPWKENLETIYRTGHTRYPLCEIDIDHVVGMVHIKDIFLQRTEMRTSADLLKIKREVLFVPESRPVESLQQDFQQRRLHMAVVIDEYGNTSGIVTMEDVLEELVGEIQDEFDSEELPRLEQTADGAVVDGQTPISEVTEALGLEHVEVKDAHTIGGYVHAQLGRIGRIGDTVELDSCVVKVLEMSGRRIMRVLIAPSTATSSAPQSEAADG